MAALLLTAAILFEVAGTLSLRAAIGRRRAWYAVVVGGYLLAFLCLSAALSHGMGLGFAYGVWTAVGIALTAIASKVLFDEPLTPVMAAGLALIACGVLLLEVGQVH
ncbi:MAG: SMR family transporter [Nocardioides sp.]